MKRHFLASDLMMRAFYIADAVTDCHNNLLLYICQHSKSSDIRKSAHARIFSRSAKKYERNGKEALRG